MLPLRGWVERGPWYRIDGRDRDMEGPHNRTRHQKTWRRVPPIQAFPRKCLVGPLKTRGRGALRRRALAGKLFREGLKWVRQGKCVVGFRCIRVLPHNFFKMVLGIRGPHVRWFQGAWQSSQVMGVPCN